MQGPDDRLREPADVRDRHHFAVDPVQVHEICGGVVELGRPAGRDTGWGVEPGIGRSQQAPPWRGQDPACFSHEPSEGRGGAADCGVGQDGPVHQHLRIDTRAAYRMVNAIGRAGGAAESVGVVELNDIHGRTDEPAAS